MWQWYHRNRLATNHFIMMMGPFCTLYFHHGPSMYWTQFHWKMIHYFKKVNISMYNMLCGLVDTAAVISFDKYRANLAYSHSRNIGSWSIKYYILTIKISPVFRHGTSYCFFFYTLCIHTSTIICIANRLDNQKCNVGYYENTIQLYILLLTTPN